MPAPKVYPFDILGWKGSLPRWALTPLAVLVLALGGTYIYKQLQPPANLISLEDANKQMQEEMAEYGLHAFEEPEKHELLEDADGKLMLRVFKDHCVLIQRQTIRGVRSKLVMDLARQRAVGSVPRLSAIFPVAYAQGACNRGCLNPHPGQFQQWTGQRRVDGWVEIWRQWPEGCQHVQLFYPPTGAWDTNPDGTPRVRWTCCVH